MRHWCNECQKVQTLTRRGVGDAAAGLGLHFLHMSEGPFLYDAGNLCFCESFLLFKRFTYLCCFYVLVLCCSGCCLPYMLCFLYVPIPFIYTKWLLQHILYVLLQMAKTALRLTWIQHSSSCLGRSLGSFSWCRWRRSCSPRPCGTGTLPSAWGQAEAWAYKENRCCGSGQPSYRWS